MMCQGCGIQLVGKDHRWFPGSDVAKLSEANVCRKCEDRLNGMVIRALSPERKPASSESPAEVQERNAR